MPVSNQEVGISTGQILGKTAGKVGSVQLLEETKIFALCKCDYSKFSHFLTQTYLFTQTGTLDDVKELHKRFCQQIFGFAMVKAQFENIMSFKHGMATHCPLGKLFDILDNDHDGTYTRLNYFTTFFFIFIY